MYKNLQYANKLSFTPKALFYLSIFDVSKHLGMLLYETIFFFQP